MNPIEQIDPTKPSGAGEAAAAAYAAALSRTMSGPVVAQESLGGGGGQALPDAVVLLGGKQTDRAAEMRKAAQTMRLEAQQARTAAQPQIAQGEKIKAEATQEMPGAQQRVADARKLETAATAKVHEADTAEAQIGAVDSEAAQALQQAEQLQQQSERMETQAALLIEIGETEGSEATQESGAQMMASAGMLEGEAKVVYNRASGKRGEAEQSRHRVGQMRTESSGSLSSAQQAVGMAEEFMLSTSNRVGLGGDMISSGNRSLSNATELDNRAALMDDQANLLSEANRIPFYLAARA